jgi:transposase
MQDVFTVLELLLEKVPLNSKNSSIPPSFDPNRNKEKKENKTGKKQGGQLGHVGKRLEPLERADDIIEIPVDRNRLPKGNYKEVGYEKRQVIDYVVSKIVKEYRVQILENENGKRFVAPFPQGVSKDVQYGNGLKSHAVYMSQYQMLPYDRTQKYFEDELKIPLSSGSLFNFNKQAYKELEKFEKIAKKQLINSPLINADETGINVGGKRLWLHSASNNDWAYLYPHTKRGCDAMNEMGVLPDFEGVLCHDHWKPYYRYTCIHALCNAHHLRELELAKERYGQEWAEQMQDLLKEMNIAKNEADGKLEEKQIIEFKEQYRKIIEFGEKECPPPPNKKLPKGKRGKIKKSKPRNLLERLRDYENDVLRFLEYDFVPFTNNQGENDIRMTKVKQKISGCFRNIEGAKIFCRIRSYILTCQKQGLEITEALEALFDAKLPQKILNAE